MKAKFLGITATAIGCLAVMPAYACVGGVDPLTCDGVTYTLTSLSTVNPAVDNFALSITGINGTSDTEGGRYGVLAFAFNNPSGFVSATAPSGFSYQGGGLDAGGCNGTGNFFCFKNDNSITQSALPADSTLAFDFSVDASSLSTWGSTSNPADFKITWDGSNSKLHDGKFTSGYDLVSEDLPPKAAAAPEFDPASAEAAFTLLAGGLVLLGSRRRKA